MASVYQQFLNAPNPALLSDKATLHYVTTLTSFTGPAEITKHLQTLQRQVKKTQQNVINTVEGQNAVVLEVDTVLEFITSGAVYLPGLDDNFVADNTVYFPVTHIVHYDADGKILQIRLQWDQGALLKQIEIIGRSGRNWPINDPREQLTLIKNSLKAAGASAPSQPSQNELSLRQRGTSNNAMRDPYASLQNFGTREDGFHTRDTSVSSPYGGSRPAQRSFTDILGDEPDGSHAHSVVSPRKGGAAQIKQRGFTDILGDEPQPGSGAHHQRSASPAKIGSHKHFQPMRLYDADEQEQQRDVPELAPKSGKLYIKPNPNKYSHFDFADGSEPADAPQRGVSFDALPKSKHTSQWSFENFKTPTKPQPGRKLRGTEAPHWDTEQTEYGDVHVPGKGRRDAETHFDIMDDQGDATPGAQRALSNITNLKDRGRTFDDHFEITDDVPAQALNSAQQNVPENRQKAAQMMESNWSGYDESPSQKENQRIHIAGDGMGSANSDDEPAVRKGYNRLDLSENKINVAGDGMGSRKGADPAPKKNYNRENLAENKINIAGDGMGGRKGTDRSWLYGGGDDELPIGTARKAPAKRGTNAQSSLWDM